jgi:hypothetical protein
VFCDFDLKNERDLLCGAKFEFDGDRRWSGWIFLVARRLSSPSFQPAISSSTSPEFIFVHGTE